MSECQKITMSKGKLYPKTCPHCGLGPCKLGFPGWYVPTAGEDMKMPSELPKYDPSKTKPFNAQEEIAAIKERLQVLEQRSVGGVLFGLPS